MDLFFTRLKLLKGVSLHERESVIIFDEVQKHPIARQSIKYLVEDGRYDYIERGFLRLYEEDFHKLDKTDKAKALFRSIPAELHKNSTRYRVSTVVNNAKIATVENVVEMMQDSKTVNIAYHSDDPNK